MTRQKKMRCRRCMWYNYNFLTKQYEDGSFCELHADAERERYNVYTINHKEEIDYEWTDDTPIK